MGYELAIDIRGGRIEIEADTVAQLERRVAALDVTRLEAAIRKARAKKAPAAKKPAARRGQRRS